MPRAIVTPERNVAAWFGSVQMGVVGSAPEQTTARSVCALAVFTLIAPCPQTVTTRFFGSFGSGSMNVDQLLERVVRSVLPPVGLRQHLVDVVFDAAARRGRRIPHVAVEALLVDVGPVDDRPAGLHPIGELTGVVRLLEQAVVLRRRDQPHDLLAEANVRDVVRGARVHVDLRVFVDDRQLPATVRHPEVLALSKVDAGSAREVVARFLIVERAEEAIGELP
jgi:hypothetical protein